MNKTLPAWQENRTSDIFRHAFALYPSDWIKDSREWIGKDKEILGIDVPGIKAAPFIKKEKSTTVTGLDYFHHKYNKDKRKKGSPIKRSPLEQLEFDLENRAKLRETVSRLPYGTTR